MQRIAPFVCALLFAPALAAADVITLKNGEVLEGETEHTPAGLIIKQQLGSLLVPHQDVSSVEARETPRQEFARRRAELAAGDQAGALTLARFCVERGLEEEARGLLLPLARAHPEHAGVALLLRDLDFHRVKGRWLAPEVYYPQRGYVRDKGRWLAPAEARVVLASRGLRQARRAAKETGRRLRDAQRDAAGAELSVRWAEDAIRAAEAELVRLPAEVEAARETLRARERDLRFTEEQALLAQQALDAWNRRGCVCTPDGCSCGWLTRRNGLWNSYQVRHRGVQAAARERDEALNRLQSVLRREAQGPARVREAEEALLRSEAREEAALAALAAAERAVRRSEDAVVRLEAELTAAKAALPRDR